MNAKLLELPIDKRIKRTAAVSHGHNESSEVMRHAILATRNVRHFSDLTLEVIDPWEANA
jgi:hypothetical protein